MRKVRRRSDCSKGSGDGGGNEGHWITWLVGGALKKRGGKGESGNSGRGGEEGRGRGSGSGRNSRFGTGRAGVVGNQVITRASRASRALLYLALERSRQQQATSSKHRGS